MIELSPAAAFNVTRELGIESWPEGASSGEGCFVFIHA